MTAFSILHATDLHITAADGGQDLLRRGFFQEYINKLHAAIVPTLGSEPDLILVTGDFVDRGAVSHMSHAGTVVDELARIQRRQ